MMRLAQFGAVIALILIGPQLFAQSYARPHYDFISILGSVSSTPPTSVDAAKAMSYLKGHDGNHPGYWQPQQSLIDADSAMTRKVFEVDGDLPASGSAANSQPGSDIDPAKLQNMSKDQQMAFAQQYMAKAMAAQQSMSQPMIEDPKIIRTIHVVDSLSVVLAKLPFTHAHEFDSVGAPFGMQLHEKDSTYHGKMDDLAVKWTKAKSGAEIKQIREQEDQLTKQWKSERVAIEDRFLSAEAMHLGEYRSSLNPILRQVEEIENKLQDGKAIRTAPDGTMYKSLLTNAMKTIAIVQDTPLDLVQDALPFMEVPQPQPSQSPSQAPQTPTSSGGEGD